MGWIKQLIESKGNKRELSFKEIEEFMEKENRDFDWVAQHEWLKNPEMPFQRPIILENGTTIWGFCTIHPDAKIGKEVMIGAFTNISGPAEIGDYVRMQGFNFIPTGVILESRV